MSALEELIPEPDRLEIDRIEVAAPPETAWKRARYGNLAGSPLIRGLFALRTLPSRLRGHDVDTVAMTIDDITTHEEPGFRRLAESDREVVLGAIGKVWKLDIPFVELRTAGDFAGFQEPGFTKVAWAIRVSPLGDRGACIELELRVVSTDDASRARFRRYFRVIGPASRFIRRDLLSSLGRELGTLDEDENERPLAGDELLPDAAAQMTHGITIRASAEAIWPWLVQMGCRRAGWYSHDWLDNAGVPSAEEIHPELQSIAVGDVLPASPEGEDGFEVLRIEKPRLLVLGGLFDPDRKKQLPFAAERPERYWHVTWSFVLEPLKSEETRLSVRARAAFPKEQRLHAAWIRPVHHFMETAQLRRLAERVEGRAPRDRWHDVAEGVVGAAGIALSLLTPFLRGRRTHWGVDEAAANREYPGDDLVPSPRWSWTHGVEIEAPAEAVWPWVSQIGADRAGFYSYQWLENVAGCDVKNAEVVHTEWAVREGDGLVLHPKMPAIPVVAVESGRYFVAHAPRTDEPSWVTVSWLFFVEPLGPARCRFISRFRSDGSDDLATRFAYGPLVTEPVGFVMDRRMLLGVKERAERK